MYVSIIRLLPILLSFISVSVYAQNQLSGKVYDRANNKPVQNVSIYIEDLKTGAVSDSDGRYVLQQLPDGTYMIGVHCLGYEAAAQPVRIKGAVIQDFALTEAEYEAQEVVVTGNSSAGDLLRTPQPITEVPNSYLIENSSTNIIDAISQIPGVSGISDGQSISKPVIRGLGYNRVVTINDGVRQEGQQWGDEFGIEVDPFTVDRVEILKGPASLVYGSDALSGVINFLPEQTLPEGQVKGDVILGYQTNNGLANGAAHMAGALKGISFSARVDHTAAHAYKNEADGYVFNSQFNTTNADGTVGIHRKWGFSQLHYSHFEMRTGIVEGAKDSTGNFLKQVLDASGQPSEEVASTADLKSYDPFVIHQLVKHDKLVWDNSVALGEGRVTARAAWQQNSRQENNDITTPDVSNIWYLLNTYSYDLRYISPVRNAFDFSIGANGMYQSSKNKGSLLLIPEYDLFDIGGFVIANKRVGKLNFSGGLRYDVRTFKGHDNYIDSGGTQLSETDPAAIHRFTAYTSDFKGVSASLGATYNASNNFYVKVNAAKGFRAPNVAESGSNGIHDGTVVYEIGDPALKPESSLQVDLTPGFRSKDVTAEISLFYNAITNFIYAKKLNSAFGGDSLNNSTPGFADASVFRYSQTDASLMGGEAVLDLHPAGMKWLDWYTCYSYVSARLHNVPDSTRYIPFVPPARLRTEITFTSASISKLLHNSYLRIGMLHSFGQADLYQQANAYQGVPDAVPATPAYTLFNAGLGTDVMGRRRKLLSLYVSVNNLANTNYTDYMSRFKYTTNIVNNVPQIGVRNMGRNVSIKLIVPIDIKSR